LYSTETELCVPSKLTLLFSPCQPHCGFEDPWAFVIACKDINCRDNWYASESTIDLNVRKRIRPSKSGKPPLKFFDGATMNKYQYSSREWETVFCRSPSPHPECSVFDGFSPEMNIVTSDNLEVTEKGLITKIDIKEGDMIMVDEQVHALHFSSHVVTTAETLSRKFEAYKPVTDYINNFQMTNGVKYEVRTIFDYPCLWSK